VDAQAGAEGGDAAAVPKLVRRRTVTRSRAGSAVSAMSDDGAKEYLQDKAPLWFSRIGRAGRLSGALVPVRATHPPLSLLAPLRVAPDALARGQIALFRRGPPPPLEPLPPPPASQRALPRAPLRSRDAPPRPAGRLAPHRVSVPMVHDCAARAQRAGAGGALFVMASPERLAVPRLLPEPPPAPRPAVLLSEPPPPPRPAVRVLPEGRGADVRAAAGGARSLRHWRRICRPASGQRRVLQRPLLQRAQRKARARQTA